VAGCGLIRSAERGLARVSLDYQVLILACAFPVRRNELLGLQCCDIDFRQNTVAIQRQIEECPGLKELKYRTTKNGEMGRRPHEALCRPRPDGTLFPAKNGHPMRPSSFWHFWYRARKATGFTKYHFHDLRHYAVTKLPSSGASSDIQKRGRWRSTVMPLRYHHATKERDGYLARPLHAAI